MSTGTRQDDDLLEQVLEDERETALREFREREELTSEA